MAVTIPSLTEVLNTEFTTTWYEIRARAIDNILNAHPVMAALRLMGAFTPQDGSRKIERTIRYQLPTTDSVDKTSILPSGVTESKTAAFWGWRYVATPVQRSYFDDQQNSGPTKIVDYVDERLQDARDSMVEKHEDLLVSQPAAYAEAGLDMQGLWEAVPPNASKDTGTYGGISRTSGNTFWHANYKALDPPIAVNLVENMNNLFNTCTKNLESPNLLVTDQTLYEVYTSFALDASQIIKESGTQLADLGFDIQKFRGKSMIWTTDTDFSGSMMFLNVNFLEMVFDPKMWFDMTAWKETPQGSDVLAQILSAMNLIGTQPRRQGLLYTA